MFASEAATFESSEQKQEPQTSEPQEQPQAPQLPTDTQQVLNILESGTLEQFVSAYIQLLQRDSHNLVGFLNQTFDSQDSNIFEFLFNAHKANSQKEWGVKTFFVTIMNIGLTLKDRGSPNIYHYLLLTSQDQPSPIYGLVQQLEPTKELNDHFIAIWNSMFGGKTKESLEQKKENFMNKLGMGKMSKNSRVTIILTLVALFTILMISAGYFIKKYGNDVPKIEAPKPVKLSVPTPVEF